MERTRQKPVGQDKGSLTEQQTKGTGTTTIQKRGIHKTNQQNRARRTEPLSRTEPPLCPPELRVSSTRTAPPLEPSMTAHGVEYPALFGLVGVGSAHPAVPLPGFW